MKVIFNISMPRCGSLALSRIFNNEWCGSHHEGKDFRILAKADNLKLSSTYAYRTYVGCREAGKNYFCNDVSCSARLLALFATDRGFLNDFSSNPENEMILLNITRNPTDVVKSLCKVSIGPNYTAQNYRDAYDPVMRVRSTDIDLVEDIVGFLKNLSIFRVGYANMNFEDITSNGTFMPHFMDFVCQLTDSKFTDKMDSLACKYHSLTTDEFAKHGMVIDNYVMGSKMVISVPKNINQHNN